MRKLEQYEKINLSPELDISYMSKGSLQIVLRSPKFLAASDGDSYAVCRVKTFHYIHSVKSEELYEVMKDRIKITTDQYYDLLEKTDMYELPKHLKSKEGDSVITILHYEEDVVVE